MKQTPPKRTRCRYPVRECAATLMLGDRSQLTRNHTDDKSYQAILVTSAFKGKRQRHGGKQSLPKGGNEKKPTRGRHATRRRESLAEAATREALEETGIVVESEALVFLGVYERVDRVRKRRGRHKQVYDRLVRVSVFAALVDGDIQPEPRSSDIQSTAWVGANTLPNMLAHKEAQSFMARMLPQLPTVFQKLVLEDYAPLLHKTEEARAA